MDQFKNEWKENEPFEGSCIEFYQKILIGVLCYLAKLKGNNLIKCMEYYFSKKRHLQNNVISRVGIFFCNINGVVNFNFNRNEKSNFIIFFNNRE